MKIIKNYIQFIKENVDNMFEYNNMIDYTLLEDSATDDDIIELCRKADILGVKSVCVLPKNVKLASEQLKDSKVLVCTVVSFPGGTDTPDQKLEECKNVISNHADEVDMVMNYELLKDRFIETPLSEVRELLVNEVSSLVDTCHMNKNKNGEKITLKVIVESGLLTNDETKIATDICLEAGADYIKSSTGKVKMGAELDKIKTMFNTIKDSNSSMKIKASGGVRTEEDINSYLPYVDRFGMGFGSVDKINGIDSSKKSDY